MQLLDILRHLPEYMQVWAVNYGSGLYLILMLIIFAETGLVVTPLLPGDSLLFAAGALLARDLPGLSLPVMCMALVAAAFCGDLVNYHVGKWAAGRVTQLKWLNPRYLERTREFYQRHGGRTIVLARFLPIVRTYAPFVAGLTGWTLLRFMSYSLLGGGLWIVLFLNMGYFFGNIPMVKRNFELVILAIVAVSLLPVLWQWMGMRRQARVTTVR